MKFHRTVLAIGAILGASGAYADKPGFGDTWTFKAGGMQQTADVEFSSTSPNRPEFSLDLEDLGMDDDASSFWAGVTWQFADSWGLHFVYSSFSTDGDAVASEDGNFGDIEWTADASLSSNYDLDLYIIDLTWDFVNTDRTHVGFGLGFHVAEIGIGLDFELNGMVGGQPVVIDSGSETADITAPLPNVVLRAGHRVGERWYLSASGGYFALEYDDIDGELVSFTAGLEWRPLDHFGLGVGYQYLDVSVKQDTSSADREIDTEAHGPVLFLSVGF